MANYNQIVVFGSSGFVGSAITADLQATHHVYPLAAPRLTSRASTTDRVIQGARDECEAVRSLIPKGTDVVINAAGLAAPGADHSTELTGANAVLPVAIALAAKALKIPRFIHISSSSVQGTQRTLTSRPQWSPRSPYAQSKALGERALLELHLPGITIHRATSVHGPLRRTTGSLVQFSRSKMAIVASPGNDPTPQVLVTQVAHAIRHIVESTSSPSITLQPNGGLTTTGLVQLLSGRAPRQVPRKAVKHGTRIGYLTANFTGNRRLWATVRRAEMFMMGQAQEAGWLDECCARLCNLDPGWDELRWISKGTASERRYGKQ